MSRDQFSGFPEDLQRQLNQYITDLFVEQTEEQAAITATTTDKGLEQIDLRPREGWMLYFLTRLINAGNALEIGLLAGYSASWIARGLTDNGHLTSIELEEHNADIARQNLEAAGLADKVKIVVGDAKDILQQTDAIFDLVFIDADKEGYPTYFKWAINHVRQGGLIIAHNAFRGGDVVGDNPDEETQRIMETNQLVAEHDKLIGTIIPAGDGLLVALVQ